MPKRKNDSDDSEEDFSFQVDSSSRMACCPALHQPHLARDSWTSHGEEGGPMQGCSDRGLWRKAQNSDPASPQGDDSDDEKLKGKGKPASSSKVSDSPRLHCLPRRVYHCVRETWICWTRRLENMTAHQPHTLHAFHTAWRKEGRQGRKGSHQAQEKS